MMVGKRSHVAVVAAAASVAAVLLLVALSSSRAAPSTLLSSAALAIPSAKTIARLPPAARALAAAAAEDTRAEDRAHRALSPAGKPASRAGIEAAGGANRELSPAGKAAFRAGISRIEAGARDGIERIEGGARSRSGMIRSSRAVRMAAAQRRAHAIGEARRAQALTDEPGVAEWVYNFEGADDAEYPSSRYNPALAPVYSGGLDSPAFARRGRAPRRVRRVALSGKGNAKGGASTQALGEISDFPDIDEDVRIKDAKQQIKDLWDPLSLPEKEKNARLNEEADQGDYAGFYRAYAAYQLPGGGRPPMPSLGGAKAILPPHGYPASPAYYPTGGDPPARLTINANGAGSTNFFKVTAPTAVNLNVGSFPGGVGGGGEDGEEEGGDGYIYPDGRTPVADAGSPTVTSSIDGSPALLAGPGMHREGAAGSGLECDPGNPGCGNFDQDAYDDAYY